MWETRLDVKGFRRHMRIGKKGDDVLASRNCTQFSSSVACVELKYNCLSSSTRRTSE